MTISPDEMKAVMRLWASGVTVVTTSDGTQHAGVTASSFSSVSLNPPLILVCLYHELEVLKQLEKNQHFAISILGEDHASASAQMAGYAKLPEGKDRFYGLDWITSKTGSPIFADAIGWADCKLHAIYDGGTHKIVVGEVIASSAKDDHVQPLVYFNRNYRKLPSEEKV